MSYAAIVYTIGLAIDILGALVLFLYSLNLTGKAPDGNLAFQTPYGEDVKKHVYGSRIGLGLLITGFAVQAISNFI